MRQVFSLLALLVLLYYSTRLECSREIRAHLRQALLCGCDWFSVYLLYSYKSANTDTCGDTGGSSADATVRFLLNLLALLVQKCKY